MCTRESERGEEESGSRCALQLHSSPRTAVCRLCEGVNQDYSGENTLFSAIRRHWGWTRCTAHASLRGSGNKWLITAGQGTIHSAPKSDYKAVMTVTLWVIIKNTSLATAKNSKWVTSGAKMKCLGLGYPTEKQLFWYKPGACSSESLKPNRLKEETAAAEISRESS